MMPNFNQTFTGFPREAFRFLDDLRVNNDKTWFDRNRATYEAFIVAPALSFVPALAARLAVFAPSVVAEPRVGGSLFRIQRDTRFSADKSPYKTHVGIRLRDGNTATSTHCTGPLFYVEFDADGLRLGVGVKAFEAPLLAAYRKAVSKGKGKRAFVDAIATAEAAGDQVLGDVLARTPPGFEDDGRETLIKRKGFFVQRERRLPKQIYVSEFVDYCGAQLEPYAAVFTELRRLAIAAAR
jgi:uncharacterized protein (TIGR02453 family)